MTLVDSDIVSVSELDFLRNASAIINQHSSRTIQNYMVWRFLMSQADILPRQFRAIKQQFDQLFQGVSTEKARPILCASDVKSMMGLAVSKLYIQKYFDENARTQVYLE